MDKLELTEDGHIVAGKDDEGYDIIIGSVIWGGAVRRKNHRMQVVPFQGFTTMGRTHAFKIMRAAIAAWNTRPARPNDTQDAQLVEAHKLAVDVLNEVRYACQYWPDYDMPINLPERVRAALAAITAPSTKTGGTTPIELPIGWTCVEVYNGPDVVAVADSDQPEKLREIATALILRANLLETDGVQTVRNREIFQSQTTDRYKSD